MKARILLIDDDHDDRDMFCQALNVSSFENVCYTEGSAHAAFRKIESKEIEPDIIFLDINMPIISGWQCLKMLKERESSRDIPVIMYSTSSYTDDFGKAERLGAVCFFTKPRDFSDLQNNLDIALAHLSKGELSNLRSSSPWFV